MKLFEVMIAGWRCQCPRCGEGALYQSYLKIDERCKICTLDFSRADAGDGAVPFVTLIAGTLGVLMGVFIMFTLGLNMFWTISSAILVGVGASLYFLPRVKSLLIAMQYYYKAGDETSLRFRDND